MTIAQAVRQVTAPLLLLFVAACGLIGPSDEDVTDFCAEVIPVIAEWRPAALEPYATDGFNQRVGQPEQARVFAAFSRLGALTSFEQPRKVGYFTSTGAGTHVVVEVPARFANGPAVLRMTLQSKGGALKLHALDVRAATLGNPPAPPNVEHQI